MRVFLRILNHLLCLANERTHFSIKRIKKKSCRHFATVWSVFIHCSLYKQWMLPDNVGFCLLHIFSSAIFFFLFSFCLTCDIYNLYSSLNLSPSQSHFVLKAKCNDYGRLNFMRNIFHMVSLTHTIAKYMHYYAWIIISISFLARFTA